MSIAVPFYDKLMPLLGFDINKRVNAVIEAHDFHVVEYSHPLLCFAITSPRSAFAKDSICRRKPGALHHLAFKAESPAEVDKLYTQLLKIDAHIVGKPKRYPEYSPWYYAVFFKDIEGIKYEIVFDKHDEA